MSNYNFVFTFVQLAGFENSDFRRIRSTMHEAIIDIPKSGMATAIDLGEMRDIHPRKKDELGRRIQLITSALEYGDSTPHRGPFMFMLSKQMVPDGIKFEARFQNTKGMEFQPSTFCTTCCSSLRTLFTVTTENPNIVYYPESITLGSDNNVFFHVKFNHTGPKLKQLQYAWEKFSQCVIVSKDMKLPIVPFTVDI
jgi:hypothetical protein